MTALRETTKRKIVEVLDRAHFTASSFSIGFAEEENPFVVISFIPDTKFRFTISDPPYNNSGYVTEEAPGLHAESGERYKRDDIGKCVNAIAAWAARIVEDYRLKNPVLDEFETLRKTLADQFEQHIYDKQAHFTAQEIETLRGKLDEFANRLKEVTEKNEEFEQSLRDAKKEIDRIKADLDVFPKGVWYRMVSSKVVGLIKKVAGSKEGREFALEAAKKFLIEGPK